MAAVWVTDLITVDEDATVVEAAAEMLRHEIRHLVVHNWRGEFIGLVSLRDVLAVLVDAMDPAVWLLIQETLAGRTGSWPAFPARLPDGWRAELHASTAGNLDQDAIAASLAATSESAKASTLATAAEADWEHYNRLGDEAARLDPSGCGNTGPTDPVAAAEASVACSVQVVFSGYNDPAYTGHGVFDTSAYADDVIANDRYGIDSDPVPYQRAADHQRSLEDRLLYLSILVVLALALFTLARLVKSRRRLLALCVPGWLLLAGTIALFVATEA